MYTVECMLLTLLYRLPCHEVESVQHDHTTTVITKWSSIELVQTVHIDEWICLVYDITCSNPSAHCRVGLIVMLWLSLMVYLDGWICLLSDLIDGCEFVQDCWRKLFKYWSDLTVVRDIGSDDLQCRPAIDLSTTSYCNVALYWNRLYNLIDSCWFIWREN